MNNYNIFYEEHPAIDIEKCINLALKMRPNPIQTRKSEPLDLHSSLFDTLGGRSYDHGCNADKLIKYLSEIGHEASIVFLKTPLLSNEFAFSFKNHQRLDLNLDLALGRADRIKNYCIVSSYGLGNLEQATIRVSKVIAHELTHIEDHLDDGCCTEDDCIMYNHPSAYTEITGDVLDTLDRKKGWCSFHQAVLFPPLLA